MIVVGAGCFGAWTALHLARAGAPVTLLDGYGAANPRSSSGGETRIIRMGYGAREIYTRWSWRSLELWKQLLEGEPEGTDSDVFREIGVLWMAREGDPLVASTLTTLGRVGVPHERLARTDLERRWPQCAWADIEWGIHEPKSGVLMARRAVHAVLREAMRRGARFIETHARPVGERGRLKAVVTSSGEHLSDDVFVFCCGPWLAKLFPDLLSEKIFVTRQEVLYFSPPANESRFAASGLPAWVDFGEEVYGIPDVDGRGFKIGIDRHGPPFDPDDGDRLALETLHEARAYMNKRFPAMRGAPIVSSEVCQYESTSSGDFLIDRHPDFENVWVVGGGSGHGFKHGPAVGEEAARLILNGENPIDCLSLTTKKRVQARQVY